MPASEKPTSANSQSASKYPLDNYTVQPQADSGEKSPYFKSGAPSINLPKGGGALKGVDEKFSVNAINGTAGLQVPLPFTPGRDGFTPSLGLSYSSGAGNSEFGLGWGLGLPSIQRRTDKQLPQYDDIHESDVFLLAGAEDLIPNLIQDIHGNWIPDPVVSLSVPGITGTCSLKRYRPRIEGLFARIEHIISHQDGSWWRVTTKDNITTWYGLSQTARIADPENPDHIFKWLPELVLDHRGNAQQYVYVGEDSTSVLKSLHEKNRISGLAPFTNTYLTNIAYCNQTTFNASNPYFPDLPIGAVTFLMEAVFDYGDHGGTAPLPLPGLLSDLPTFDSSVDWPCRVDPFSDFHAGFEIRTYRKCKSVMMFHRFAEMKDYHNDTYDPVLVRSLDLTYQHDGSTDYAEADLLVSVTQTGYNVSTTGYTYRQLPSMVLDYQPLQWNNTVHDVSPQDAQNAPQGLTGSYQWIDLHGEGIPGILSEQSNGWFYKSNLGDGHFSPALAVAEKPSFRGLGTSMQWQDLDADGRRQLVSHESSTPGYFELDDDQHWQPFRAFKERLNIDWNSPYTKMLDLDGDGRPDILVTEDRVWTWYKNAGTDGFTSGGYTSTCLDEEKGPRLVLNDNIQSIFLADMNGDGMTDIVRIKNGEVCYWPNKGYGRFGAKVAMSNAPVFDYPDLYNPLYLQITDISGTGAADLVYLASGVFKAWINLAGNAFSASYDIATLPRMESYSKVGVMDFLGNGTGCLVWSSPLPQYAATPMKYVDLMGGVKPYLMIAYHSGLGKTVELTYKSSTKYYLQDKLSGTPWATRLPFPVQCLDKITTTDGVSQTTYTQSLTYHHGYYDHDEREFRGFGRVDTLDTDSAVTDTVSGVDTTLDQAPVLTKTWYHTGAYIREQSLLIAFGNEYFLNTGWSEPSEQATFPTNLYAQELREAHRALKGAALRQEVYALDGDITKQSIPYTITLNRYEVLEVQPLNTNRYASFRLQQTETFAWSSERIVSDARLLHSLTLKTDELGNVLQSASVAYPRQLTTSPVPTIVATEQAKMHISSNSTAYTNDVIDSLNYRLRVPYSAQEFECANFSIPTSGTVWDSGTLLNAINTAPVIDYAATPSGAQKRLLTDTIHIYLGDNTTSILNEGIIESLCIPFQQYTQAFSSGILTGTGGRINSSNLAYPQGGYIDLHSDGNWWIPSGTVQYSSSPTTDFYTPISYTDPWHNVTSVAMTNYHLLPAQTIDAVGNRNSVDAYDWRCLQPTQITDLNKNVSELLYDDLCMPVAMAVKGKNHGDEGDNIDGIDPEDITNQGLFWTDPQSYAATLLGNATWRCVYALDTFDPANPNPKPIAVAMIAREIHYVDNPDSPVLIRISYSDSFGRVVMHKVQAADDPTTGDPRWIGSGKTVYNNKGKAVLQYEPYFSTLATYDAAEQSAAAGISPKMKYDPLGRLVRSDMPDGTFSLNEWDAWSQTIYDPNDTTMLLAGSTPVYSAWYTTNHGGTAEQQDAATKALAHANTPTVVHLDTLARPFYTLQNDGINPLISSYETLDIQGNRLIVTDGRNVDQFAYTYNMVKVLVNQKSVDSGEQFLLSDAGGQPLNHWDAADRLTTIRYDIIRRPIQKIADSYIQENITYGEGQTDDFDNNLRGQVYAHYDGGGKQTVQTYTLEGPPSVTIVQLLHDTTITDVDWNSLTDADLDHGVETDVDVDALGRVIDTTDPGGNYTEYTYGKDGALETVNVNGDPYVADIHHNAKGQREAIWYGNDTKTSYTYDALNYRLTRLLTVNTDTNDTLQDLDYWYDPVGNITQLEDTAQATVFSHNTMITPTLDYTYDALYRLIQSKGREQKGGVYFGGGDNTDDKEMISSMISPFDGNALQNYTQYYQYDEVGNILKLQHVAATGSYTRNYTYGTTNNQLSQTTVGSLGGPYYYDYDQFGNLTRMPSLDPMKWNIQNQFSQAVAGSMTAYYQYSGGQRIRKTVNKSGGIQEQRIYLGNYEIFRSYTSGTLTLERTTVHVSDDTGRIAMLETLTQGSDGSLAELKRFIYSNHLQSSSLELDDSGAVISYEEYHPYGTTAYQANNSDIKAVAKRYRFTGKERDEESGLYYHGARYYIPWLCRWAAVDPLESKYPGLSSYNYCTNNPILKIDPTGGAAFIWSSRGDEKQETEQFNKFKAIVEKRFGGLVTLSQSEYHRQSYAQDPRLSPNQLYYKLDIKINENKVKEIAQQSHISLDAARAKIQGTLNKDETFLKIADTINNGKTQAIYKFEINEGKFGGTTFAGGGDTEFGGKYAKQTGMYHGLNMNNIGALDKIKDGLSFNVFLHEYMEGYRIQNGILGVDGESDITNSVNSYDPAHWLALKDQATDIHASMVTTGNQPDNESDPAWETNGGFQLINIYKKTGNEYSRTTYKFYIKDANVVFDNDPSHKSSVETKYHISNEQYLNEIKNFKSSMKNR